MIRVRYSVLLLAMGWLIQTTVVLGQQQQLPGAPTPVSIIFSDGFEALPELVSCGAPPPGAAGQCGVTNGNEFLLIRSDRYTQSAATQCRGVD